MNAVSLIVGFDQAPSHRKLGALHRKFGVRQEEKLELINGYTVNIPEDQVDEYLSSLPESAQVMQNEPLFSRPDAVDFSDVSDDAEQPLPYISRPLGMTELHAKGIRGKGSTIAVVDSGISPHRDFQDRIKFFKDFGVDPHRKPYDEYGHGTHVAGIAAGDGDEIDGVAPEAELVGLRISSAKEAIEAIGWAVDHKEKLGINIINISLGITDTLPGFQDPFALAAQKAINAGILTVVAAGNEGNKCDRAPCRRTISTPGTLPDAITVGAYSDSGTVATEDDVMLKGSSIGPTAVDGNSKPDIVAPGGRILATSASGSIKARSLPTWRDYHFDWGTSMSAPMVAGALALLREINPEITQIEAKRLLQTTAAEMPGVETVMQGAGRLNLAELIERARGVA